ncbi:ATR [Cordylochernes scorpioides]|uniref:ATR n=1 Tax=Cordylochernes scorpioides TaxID=51811 RepID=A0ABY6KQX0_9ARAC|nr:ATR [Cordylochernes scorpioides]
MQIPEEIGLEQCRRLSRKANSPLLIEVPDYKQRILLLRNAFKLRDKKIFLNKDYPAIVREQNKAISFKGNLRDLAILPLTGSTLNSQVESLTIEIQTAMSRAGMRREIRSGGLRSKPWYDEECYTAKKKMKESLKLYILQNNVVNKDLFITNKKEYLSLIKLKKNQYFDDIQNASQFWKIIKYFKQRTTIKGNILMCDWEDFYRRLLASPPIMDAYISPALTYMDPELDAKISLMEGNLSGKPSGLQKGFLSRPYFYPYLTDTDDAEPQKEEVICLLRRCQKGLCTVPHSLLWKKLTVYGLSTRFISLIQSYYN